MKKMIVGMVGLILGLAGCTHAASPEKSELPQSRLNTDKHYNLVFTCPFTDNEYWQEYLMGIRDADKVLGTKTTLVGSSEAEQWQLKMAESLQKAVDMKPDGIITYAGIPNLDSPVRRADENNIPLVTVGGDVNSKLRVAHISTDMYKMGCQAGNELIERLNGEGKVGILVSSKASTSEMEVVCGFIDTVDDYHIEIVFQLETEGQKETAEKLSIQKMTEIPDLDSIFCTASTNITGAGLAAKKLNNNEIICIGFDDTPENVSLLKEGYIDALILQSPKDAGFTAVRVMKEFLDKGHLTKSNYVIQSQIIRTEDEDIDEY